MNREDIWRAHFERKQRELDQLRMEQAERGMWGRHERTAAERGSGLGAKSDQSPDFGG